jgi:uncharacterized damage-inducible protein DinB
MHLERLGLLYGYDLWANRRVLESVRKASERGDCLRLFGHLLAAQEIWLARLWAQDSSGVKLWAEHGVEDCEAAMERLAGEMRAYLEAASGESVAREISYRTQDGTELRNTPLDILTHLSLHGQHHRGQIIWELRKLGQDVVSADMIFYLRR